jgi:hypothetical protein
VGLGQARPQPAARSASGRLLDGLEHRLDHFALSFRVHAGQALAVGSTVAHELPASFLHFFDGSGKMLAHQRIERDRGFDAGGVEHVGKAP